MLVMVIFAANVMISTRISGYKFAHAEYLLKLSTHPFCGLKLEEFPTSGGRGDWASLDLNDPSNLFMFSLV